MISEQTSNHFVTGGGLRVDYLITPQGAAHVRMPGGNALYTAVGAAIWHDQVAVWARKGENFPDEWLLEIAELGIDLHQICRIPGKQEHRTFFAYTSESSRVDTEPAKHFARIGIPMPPELEGYVNSTPAQDDPDSFEPMALRPTDWHIKPQHGKALHVHIAPQPLATHAAVPAKLREMGVKTITIDPGERYMIPERQTFVRTIMSQIDAFMPSDQEVKTFFGDDIDLWQAADTFCQWGAPLVVIKNGPEGVLLQKGVGAHAKRAHIPAYHGSINDGAIFDGPIVDGHIVDVTGAGDAFCGGFLVGLATSGDPILAAQMGVVSASMVIEGYGAAYALKCDRAEAQKRLQKLDTF